MARRSVTSIADGTRCVTRPDESRSGRDLDLQHEPAAAGQGQADVEPHGLAGGGAAPCPLRTAASASGLSLQSGELLDRAAR